MDKCADNKITNCTQGKAKARSSNEAYICKQPWGEHYPELSGEGNQTRRYLELSLTYKAAMLILALGLWLIPMTLIFAPCRRLVLLVAKLQELRASFMRGRSSYPAAWSLVTRIQTISITL